MEKEIGIQERGEKTRGVNIKITFWNMAVIGGK